jgi:hypothetical protein
MIELGLLVIVLMMLACAVVMGGMILMMWRGLAPRWTSREGAGGAAGPLQGVNESGRVHAHA